MEGLLICGDIITKATSQTQFVGRAFIENELYQLGIPAWWGELIVGWGRANKNKIKCTKDTK